MAMSGRDRHLSRLKRLTSPEAMRKLNAALMEGADTIKAEAQKSITTGAVSGAGHVPSAPGEPPNNDLDHLRENIESYNRKALVVEVRSEAEYAGDLEFGTSKMAARPYMRPARDKKLKEVRDTFAAHVDRIVKGS